MAVSTVGLRIIERAVQIRLAQGETLDDILDSYPKLSQEQAEALREKYGTSE